MRIFIDIGHPAHVHYFKNFASIMKRKGHEFLFMIRDKESTIALIEELGFNYINRGKGGGNIFTKLGKLLFIDYQLFKAARNFKPDLFLSFASPYAAHVSRIMRKPHIAFDDTEHAVFAHILYRPFSDVVLSPSCYLKEKKRNQYFFNSFMELCHLHPNYFIPDRSVREDLGIGEKNKFIILRFVSWDANHDVGQNGLSPEAKIKLVKELKTICNVFISSESKLPDILKPYQLKTHPSKLHSILSEASLYIGEGSTTACESSILGTPSIYVNSLKVGNCNELEGEYGLCYQLINLDNILMKANEILLNQDNETLYGERAKKLLAEKIDPTQFMVWFVENWPLSKQIIIEDPEFQNRFKT
jgi:uncharacterized protein